MAVTNNPNTAASVMKLSNIMRYVTDEVNEDFVPLQSEIECIKDYVDLQRLRLNKKTAVDFEVSGKIDYQIITPLVLMTFVENAFKHGISLRNSSWIYIKLYCQQDQLHFSVFNSLHPRHEEDPEKHSSGIGLVNVQKRLERLYPKNHQLHIHRTEKEFSVNLVIDQSAKKSRRILSKISPKQMPV